MSHVQAMKVQYNCPEQGGEFQALMALAFRAGDDGGGIWADDLDRLAREARMSTGNFRVVLKKLMAKGRVTLETGLGPQGRDLFRLHLPTVALTAQRWYDILEARKVEKRARCKPLGRPVGRKATPSPERNDLLPPVLPPLATSGNDLLPWLSALTPLKTMIYSPQGNNSFPRNGLFPAPGADFWAPYRPVPAFTDVVIHLASDARDSALASEVTPAPAPDQDPLDNWGEEDDRLFSPVGEAPDGAALVDDPDPAPDLLGMHGANPPNDVQEVPRRGPPAAPGDPVYERLVELCGGSVKDPNLLKLLGEKTRGDVSRREWLRLTLSDVEDARALAKRRSTAGEAVFRTALIEALDALVDGDAPPTARAPFMGYEQLARPGDGEASVRDNPWRVGMRVRHGLHLGVILSATADARQASVTVDLDNGERAILTGRDFGALREVAGAPPPPARSARCAPGTRWRLPGGEVVTVVSLVGATPTTSDGTVWPPFGKLALLAVASPVDCGHASGAA